ncbi:hypothetical protein [Streptomyces griseoaurantiacus]|uniref:hypothetical protein n=1 Tax=Streptomyces griseoaurantiacus TaxID=68213 RepID=UPI0037BB8D2F
MEVPVRQDAYGTLVGVRRPAPRPAGPRPLRRDRGRAPLAAVAALFTLAQLALVRPDLGLGWDETVYVSQLGTQAPAAFFSAPRARGVPLLVAPVASWSSSTVLLRAYLAVLSGLGLYLAFRSWRGLLPARVLTLAGALFATLWVTLFYGPQAMPNLWVAYGALAAAACFQRARADSRDRAALWGLGTSAALMAWMRPTDAVWATVPLFLLVLAPARGRRRVPSVLVPAGVLAGGLAAGAVEWIVEAYTSYGGLGRRLAEASRIQGGLGWNLAFDDQLRGLAGRALCRPCAGPLPPVAETWWWYTLPPLAVLGTLVAVRARRPVPAVPTALACATTVAIPYLLLIGYAAPRFLLPAYALLSLPVAVALLRLTSAGSGRWRTAARVLVAAGLLGHLVAQYSVLDGVVERSAAGRRGWARTAAALHGLGVRPPCLLTGREAIPVAYYTGCASAQVSGHNENSTPGRILEAATRVPVAALTAPDADPPGFARGWAVHRYGGVWVWVARGAR